MQDKKELLRRYLKNPREALFLDIETEGLSRERNGITIIGIYKEDKYLPFIRGFNLERALHHLATTPIWITFGGDNFDIPFIKKAFQGRVYPSIHIDLYHYTGLIGLRGGLKRIEKALGLARKTEGMTGYDAVRLWKRWVEERDKLALRTLILYNREDVINLKIILNYVIESLLGREEE